MPPVPVMMVPVVLVLPLLLMVMAMVMRLLILLRLIRPCMRALLRACVCVCKRQRYVDNVNVGRL